jgi:hypothetical protein
MCDGKDEYTTAYPARKIGGLSVDKAALRAKRRGGTQQERGRAANAVFMPPALPDGFNQIRLAKYGNISRTRQKRCK